MGTKIQYVDETINPIQDKIKGESGRGYHCTKVSPGCLHCYAEGINNRFGNHLPFDNRQVEFELIYSELRKPLHWKKPRRIFLCSMSDWMHPDVKTKQIDQILEVVSACPQHTFFSLTKRPGNLEKKLYEVTEDNPIRELGGGDYIPNLWLGVTVCNADELWKIKELLSIPGFKKWVSVEPALGAINIFTSLLKIGELPLDGNNHKYPEGIDWIAAGSETGPGARPADNEWFRSLRDQCKAAGIPYFQKACSGPTPDDLMIQEFPKTEWNR